MNRFPFTCGAPLPTLKVLLTMLLLVLLLTPSPRPAAASPRPTVDMECMAFGSGPQLECTVRLRGADGRPLNGAAVTLGASMPSMPMAHRVHPASAAPTKAPGEYRGRLSLEMSGAWSVQVDIAGPVRDRVHRTLQVHECEGDRRCPARPVPSLPTGAAQPAHKH